MLSLDGMGQEAEPGVLHLRSAVAGQSVWLDLGDTTGRAVQITEHDWRIRESALVLIHRTALTAALPEPKTGGTLGELWAMLNVAPDDHPLDTSPPTGMFRIRCDSLRVTRCPFFWSTTSAPDPPVDHISP